MARGGVDGVSELCVARACMAIYMQHVCTMYVRHHSALVTCRRCCCAPGLRWRRTCSDGRLTNALAAQWRWTMLQPFHYQCRLERDPECSLYRQAGVNTRVSCVGLRESALENCCCTQCLASWNMTHLSIRLSIWILD